MSSHNEQHLRLARASHSSHPVVPLYKPNKPNLLQYHSAVALKASILMRFDILSIDMYIILLYLVLLAVSVQLKIVPDLQEIQGCPDHDYEMDFSNLQFDFDDDGYLIVNGNLTILKDVVEPYPVYIHSERMERGEWRPALIEKYYRNFCTSFQDPLEVSYPVMRHVDDLKCPLPAGVRLHLIPDILI